MLRNSRDNIYDQSISPIGVLRILILTLWLILAKILIEPNSALIASSEPYHLVIYFEVPHLLIDRLVPDQSRVEDTQALFVLQVPKL